MIDFDIARAKVLEAFVENIKREAPGLRGPRPSRRSHCDRYLEEASNRFGA